MLSASTRTALPSGSALELVLGYHERTKHHFARYAQGPETLDWDAQPAAFRNYLGSETLPLPLLSELSADHPHAMAFAAPFVVPAVVPTPAWTLASLGLLLQMSLGVTAWKSYGPDRWAVRANPSSGNLHPVEAYVVARGMPFLADGVWHYCSRRHELERRARWESVPAGGSGLFIALTSVMWREMWKYGERAFRYCQLDVGHAVCALSVASAILGAELERDRSLGSLSLSRALGTDSESHSADAAEREEPELALRVGLSSAASVSSLAELLPTGRAVRFEGRPSIIDPRPMYRWPVVEQVALSTRTGDGLPLQSANSQTETTSDVSAPQPVEATSVFRRPPARDVLLGRRSAQRFDIQHVMPHEAFCSLLRALLPDATPPWRLAQPARIDLVLFVHRVEDVVPGIYFLGRRGKASDGLRELLQAHFASATGVDLSPELPLTRLCAVAPRELMRTARALHCHQDIASNGCLALGMIAEFRDALAASPAVYRDLHQEAGLVGQVLYLEAEALGLRGTGIGCFFDEAVHELLGLSTDRFQSLYHFTLGRPLDDPRIEHGPPYPERQG